MIPAQFSLEESQLTFLEQCQVYGFQDPSAVVRTALNRFFLERESATLYAELYETDEPLKELTELAIEGWPT